MSRDRLPTARGILLTDDPLWCTVEWPQELLRGDCCNKGSHHGDNY